LAPCYLAHVNAGKGTTMAEMLLVSADAADKRLDGFLAEVMDISRSQAQLWIEKQLVQVDGIARGKNYKIRAGECVTVQPPPLEEYQVRAENIPLDVVYEDADLLVVNKPKGMVVHPAAGHYEGTLVNALMYHCGDSLSGINGVMRPGIVHRIDKDTSGLLIVAKNDRSHQGLAEQISAHSFTRIYETVVVGHLKEQKGTICAPIGRHPAFRKKMAVVADHSKPAVTHYEVIAEYPGYSHLRVRLETGRTHQIRVHMAFIGHPVAGDTVYGGLKQPKICSDLMGQCLHARCIGFVHPLSGEELYFESALPSYFLEFIHKLENQKK